MKKILVGTIFLLTALAAQAGVPSSDAASFLLQHPAPKYKLPDTAAITSVEELTKPMFSLYEKVKFIEGLKNFQILQNLSNRGNPYAAYNVGIYMMLNREKLGFKFSDALLQLKKASDQNVVDAKYALALIYQQRSIEVSTLVNTADQHQIILSPKEQIELNKQIKKDEIQFKNIANQYLLELAQLGHEKSFLAACNFYITGEVLKRNFLNAAICYDNAIRIYDQSVAYARLAKIYFDAPDFDEAVFEKKGMSLAETGARKGDTYAMAILGKQLIFPKFSGHSNIEMGTQLIQAAAAYGDPIGIDYMRLYFDKSGKLLIQPNKPIQ